MKKLFIIVPLLLSACAIATPLPPQNGKKAFLIECDGAATPLGACFSKANELCEGDYTLAGGGQTNHGNITGGQSSMSGMATPYAASISGQSSLFSAPYVQKNIAVICKR